MAVTLVPLGTKLVVTLIPDGPRTTASGLHLGDSTTHLQWGTVTAIGPEVTLAHVGDVVLVNVLVGQEVHGQLILPETGLYGTKA